MSKERAMIVLGLGATLIACMTLMAFALLDRIEHARERAVLRVL